jgi:hypothetical protein
VRKRVERVGAKMDEEKVVGSVIFMVGRRLT